MNATDIYNRLRANGDIFVAVSLSSCLVWRYGGLGIPAVYLGLLILASKFKFIWTTIKGYDHPFVTSFRGEYFKLSGWRWRRGCKYQHGIQRSSLPI